MNIKKKFVFLSYFIRLNFLSPFDLTHKSGFHFLFGLWFTESGLSFSLQYKLTILEVFLHWTELQIIRNQINFVLIWFHLLYFCIRITYFLTYSILYFFHSFIDCFYLLIQFLIWSISVFTKLPIWFYWPNIFNDYTHLNLDYILLNFYYLTFNLPLRI